MGFHSSQVPVGISVKGQNLQVQNEGIGNLEKQDRSSCSSGEYKLREQNSLFWFQLPAGQANVDTSNDKELYREKHYEDSSADKVTGFST